MIFLVYNKLGAEEYCKGFAVGGTSAELLYGVCEAFYKENMDQDELFEVI